ncbi:MAG: hypothetical protein HYV02_07935 [Deltaproteobacteria bacterium]|nr:hypothetical protein [Deltaproteobacteria bacterium]
MKTMGIYLLVTVVAVAMIWGVIRYGHRLSAPPALPDQWMIAEASLTQECRLLRPRAYPLVVEQSGESLNVVWAGSPHWAFHGKIDRQGRFHLSGRLMQHAEPGCRRVRMTWEGIADQTTFAGTVRIVSPGCPLCPEGLHLTATPVSLEPEPREDQGNHHAQALP